ncbi:hypothetical protein SESBI_13351 [Sesbania bispinosa]|nr:hypothetical protein SESBI_13351 [Sesbania bispinosa]
MTPTSQSSQLDLHQINKSHHQEPTSENRSKSRNESSQPQSHGVNFHNEANTTVHDPVAGGSSNVVDGALANVDDVFESQGDEAGEEEGAEGVHVVGYEAFSDRGCGGAGGIGADEGVVGVGGCDAEEEC